MVDPVVNFFKSQIDPATLPVASTDTTITISAGDGAKLPTPEFDLVIYDASQGSPEDDPNREIVTVTAISTDTLTVNRGQQGTTATDKLSGEVYPVILSYTKKVHDQFDAGLVKIPVVASITSTDSPYTINGQHVVKADSSSGNIDVNLPDATTLVGTYDELPIKITKTDWTDNVVWLLPNGTQKINGQNKQALLNPQESIELYPTTEGWIII